MLMVTRLLALSLVLLVLAGCGLPTVEELEGQTFDDVRELGRKVRCGEVKAVFDLQPVGTETAALDAVNSDIVQAEAVRAVDAGGIYLLVDADGEVFGGIGKAPATVFMCVNH